MPSDWARGNRKDIEVIACESKSYGEAMARELRSYGIPVQLIPDSAIRHRTSRAKRAFVGADSVLRDGSVINGTPTLELALAARDAGINFHPVCETMKFDIRGYPGDKPGLEEGFDYIPSSLITGIITEEGMIRPGEVIGRLWGAGFSPPP